MTTIDPGAEAIPLQLSAQQVLVLDDPDRVWVLREGYVGIYVVRIDKGRPAGARQHLFSCNEGIVLCGKRWTENDVDHALIAVAIDDCLIDGHSPQSLAALGQRTALEDGLAQWAQHLTALLTENESPTFAERPAPGAPFVFRSGQTFRPQDVGLHVLELRSGRLQTLGLQRLELSPEHGGDIAAGDELWFRVVSDEAVGVFHVASGAPALAPLIRGTQTLTSLFVGRVLDRLRQAELEEIRRFERLASIEGNRRRQTVDLLSFVPRVDDVRAPGAQDRPLLNALQAVGKPLGITFLDDPSFRLMPRREEQIEAITRLSGTRARRVRLRDKWWDDDVGPLLAFRKANGSPVALVQRASWWGMSRRYQVIDGETGAVSDLTETLAEDFEEVAYSFVRPLPVMDELSFNRLSWAVIKPYLPDFKLMLLFSFLTGLLGAVMPVANRMMIDKVIPDANRDLMQELAVGLAGMSIGLFLFGLSTGLISIRVRTAMTAHMQAAVMDRLLRLPLKFFRQYSSGDLLNRAMMISEISAGFSMTTLSTLFGLLGTLIMLFMCFLYSAKLALLAVAAAVLTAVFSITYSFLMRQKSLELEKESGVLFGFVTQMINGVTKLQIAGADQRALNQWARRYGHQLRESYAIAQLQHQSSLVNMTVQTGSTIALYYLAGGMVAETAAMQAVSPLAPALLTVGVFFAVQGAFGAVIGGIVGFFSTFITIYQQLVKRELVRPILSETVESGANRTEPGRIDGHIAIHNVTFRYQPEGPKVLDNISLKVHPGEFIALVGPSGSGKSTILKLLLGFDFPESGQILVDKKDVAELNMLSVRRQIGVVLQDGKINAGTLYHAICGASSLSMDEAWEAAEAAGFAEDVKSFPMGMHTLLPEGASTLSGGQRQRLLIARALATRPRMVFFDEATSALDNRTQAIVTESLRKRKVTRVVIAHRLNTIIDADRIYVLDKGAILQSGTYAELMQQEGSLFHRMASRQIA
jgi:NHLM bacteriocin system ABC transporter ATP-binding protein